MITSIYLCIYLQENICVRECIECMCLLCVRACAGNRSSVSLPVAFGYMDQQHAHLSQTDRHTYAGMHVSLLYKDAFSFWKDVGFGEVRELAMVEFSDICTPDEVSELRVRVMVISQPHNLVWNVMSVSHWGNRKSWTWKKLQSRFFITF